MPREKNKSDITQKMIEEVEKYGAKNYKPLPVVLCRGSGSWVWDIEGNKYLDCLSAYSAVNQGHCHPRIVRALQDQAATMTLSSRAFHNDQLGPFLRELCDWSGYEKALPMNSGAEAVETALKIMRKWGYLHKKIAKEQAEIIVCANNFHGRTITVISASSEPSYREGFGPFTPGFKIVPYGNIQSVHAAIGENTVGVLMEPIQGEAGIIIPPKGFLKNLQKTCHDKQILFALDEIQTGLGRTGKDFCYQHELSTPPDILILGKALSGGLYPVSVVLSSNQIMSVIGPGQHGSTFGGNSLASRVAKEAIAVLCEEKLSERSANLGEYFLKKLENLRSYEVVKDVRGRGLMMAVEIHKAHGSARPYCEALMRLGVLAKETHDQVIRLTPPLVIQESELDWLYECLSNVLANPH